MKGGWIPRGWSRVSSAYPQLSIGFMEKQLSESVRIKSASGWIFQQPVCVQPQPSVLVKCLWASQWTPYLLLLNHTVWLSYCKSIWTNQMCKISAVLGMTHCALIMKITFASLILDSLIFFLINLDVFCLFKHLPIVSRDKARSFQPRRNGRYKWWQVWYFSTFVVPWETCGAAFLQKPNM